MNKPMTTAEAELRYGCNHPIEEDCQCLLDSTCSYDCPSCKQRIWFPSYASNHGNPVYADCPYCSSPTINPHPEYKP